MSSQEAKYKQFNRLFLHDKQENILDHCYQKCTAKSKPGSSLSGREVTCIENCQIKLLNAYDFMFNIIKDGGVYRGTEAELKKMAL